ADVVGEAHGLELVLREAALAHALERELEPAAALTALAPEREVFLALAEVDRGGEPGVATAAVLLGIEAARLQVAVVARRGAAAREVVGDAAARLELLELRRRREGEGCGAVAVARQQDAVARLRPLERRGEEQRRERDAGVAELAEQRIDEHRAVEPQRG